MSLPLITIEDVLKSLRIKKTYKREALIRSAYAFAEEAHKNQKRKSGEDYIQHPLHTALNLSRIGMGSKTISAGLLHDVLEDTGKTLEDIEKKFGKEISFMVDGVTKLGNLKLRNLKEEAHMENLRKMFLAMASDIRVVIIRLADRLHNMETLEIKPEEKGGELPWKLWKYTFPSPIVWESESSRESWKIFHSDILTLKTLIM